MQAFERTIGPRADKGKNVRTEKRGGPGSYSGEGHHEE